ERAESLAGVYVFIKIATAGVIFSFLLAWLGSRQLLKPVQRLAETARGINELNLSQRLEVEGTGELAALASTFNAMMDRVQAAFDSQRNFVNDAGHELRTPITIIQGHLELMDDDPEEQRETLEIVMDELDRMGRFVNDLVLLAKADRPDFLQPETLDLASFTEVVFGKMTALDKRNWQLVNIGHGKFVADRQRITGALLNLAQNATQHTQPTDTIELGSSLSKGRVRFWVHDTGEGIAPADQQRIFDRFARAANSYRRSEGAGLGLAIVSAIAEAHKGHVELTSQLGVGSTFSLILPL
ncbi:MAG: ATP-binding protein, partial [Cyanobacteria bacterium J06559_3]